MADLSRLTDEQREAVLFRGGPLALLAGAGSGKTTVLVNRYVDLLRRQIKPREILTVTFTNEAADQLRERIRETLIRDENPSEELLESLAVTPNIGTIHSFCYRLLDHYGTLVGLSPIRSILSPFELAVSFDRAYRDWLEGLEPERLRGLLEHFTHNTLRSAAREAYDNRHWPTNDEILKPAVEPLFQRLEKEFAGRGVYGFDDLEAYAQTILQERPEVVERLRKEFRHVLIDEFQDTSRAQWAILRRLAEDDPAKLFLIGDPKQSIYGFRHADVSVFLEAAKQMETRELSLNFRSQPTLLGEINRLSEGLFTDSLIPFAPMRAGKAAGVEGSPLQVRRYAEKDEEIGAVVTAVQELNAKGVALLFRVSDRIPAFYQALTAAGIPAECRRTGRLFHSYDVIDLVAYLRALNNPLDNFHLGAFLRSSFVRFTRDDLWAVYQRPGKSLFEKLFGDPRLGWFFGVIESGQWRVREVLKALFTHGRHFPAHGEALMALLSALTEENLSIPEAVDRIEAWEKEDLPYQALMGDTRGAVRLMTVHAAKGLEFPHVLLVDLCRKGRGEAETEESKRVLYVALTRAETSLTLFLPFDASIAPKDSWAVYLNDQINE